MFENEKLIEAILVRLEYLTNRAETSDDLEELSRLYNAVEAAVRNVS